MIWESPEMLWLLVLVALLPAAAFYLRKKNREKMNRFFSDELLDKLKNSPWKPADRTRQVFLYTGLALLVIGMAGPKIGSEIREVKRQGVDLMIALDVSRSMLAEDVRPNRLEKAKFEIQSLVNRLQGDRIGLVLFSNVAFLQTPLTTDYSAFNMYLDLASTDQLPTAGTDFNTALRTVRDAFKSSGTQSSNTARVLLFFSDGEDHSPSFEQELRRLVQDDVVVYTVGIGTTQGAVIPVYDRRTGTLSHYHRDRDGRVVNSRLEAENLRKMARIGGGTYYEIQRGSDRIDGFISKLEEMERRTFASELFSDYKNRYQIPTAAGLLFVFISLIIPAYKKAAIKLN